MGEQNAREAAIVMDYEFPFGKALTVFLVVIGMALLVNVASYFVLSDHHGRFRKGEDSVTRIGFPFLVHERGGVDGRNRFYWTAVGKNVAVAVSFAIPVTSFWFVFWYVFSRRDANKPPEE
jgi:hypothetical protein